MMIMTKTMSARNLVGAGVGDRACRSSLTCNFSGIWNRGIFTRVLVAPSIREESKREQGREMMGENIDREMQRSLQKHQ